LGWWRVAERALVELDLNLDIEMEGGGEGAGGGEAAQTGLWR
jgi:hypothetical protein